MDKRFADMIQDSAKGSLVLIIGQMISTAISAIGAIIVARILGSNSFGLIAIANIPVSIALMLINNGVSNALINYMVEDRHLSEGENIQQIIFTGFTINLTIGTIVTFSLYILSGFIANKVFSQPELEKLIQILSITILGQALFTTSTAVLVGFEKMAQRSLANITYSILKSIIGPALVYLGYNVVGAAYGYSIPHLITGIFGVILVYLNLTKTLDTIDFSFNYLHQIVNYSRPLFFSNLLAGGFLQALNFILPFYVSAALIGNLSAARSFNVLISFFLVPISVATFPLLSKLTPRDDILEFVYQGIIKYKAMIAYPVAAAVIALSSQMVEILYGSGYSFSPLFIRVLMLNYFFIGFGDTVSGGLLNSQKKTEIILRRILIYLFIGIPMGFILIPRYGVLGFLATTLLAPKFGLFYEVWWIRENWGLDLDIGSTSKIFLSVFLGYVGCYTILWVVDLNPWMELFIGGGVLAVIYLVSILVTGVLSTQNIQDIKNITKR